MHHTSKKQLGPLLPCLLQLPKRNIPFFVQPRHELIHPNTGLFEGLAKMGLGDLTNLMDGF
jgi:hypothetical protein